MSLYLDNLQIDQSIQTEGSDLQNITTITPFYKNSDSGHSTKKLKSNRFSQYFDHSLVYLGLPSKQLKERIVDLQVKLDNVSLKGYLKLLKVQLEYEEKIPIDFFKVELLELE